MTAQDGNWREELRRWLRTPGARGHLMGVGGIGMAGVARLLAARGLTVTGCDGGAPRTLAWLRSCGIPATTGHAPAHLDGIDWAIFSPALQPGHPERAAAEQKGIPLYRRGQVLPVLAELWKTVAVSGTHGKTTTSSMIAHILRAGGADPSWCIGGELPPDGAPAGIGQSEWLAIEADESDGTLAHYAPEIAVITNVEFDHMEHFDSKEAMAECFRAFARQAKAVVVCADDPERRKSARKQAARPTGLRPARISGARFRSGTGRHAVTVRGQPVALPLPGRHKCRMRWPRWRRANGAESRSMRPRRRWRSSRCPSALRARGGSPRDPIVADNAHHPSEIRALIDAANKPARSDLGRVPAAPLHAHVALGAEFPPAFAAWPA
jgi:UDP-N-acetylmuramate--alanine ligase